MNTDPNQLFVTLASIIGDVFNLLALLVIIRVFFSWIPSLAYSRNPFVQFTYRVVDPMLRPFRRIIPTLGGLDVSPLALLIVLEFLGQLISNLPDAGISPLGDTIDLLTSLILGILSIICIIVLVRFVLVLFHADPHHQLVQTVRYISQPFIAPFSSFGKRGTSVFDVPALIALIVYSGISVVFQIVFSHFGTVI